jgi:hypothetical protein
MTMKISLSIDENNMIPPWEAFPTYERYTMGWRMGDGEDYFYDWHTFIEGLSNDYETRLNYLISHRPAPLNWCDHVFRVLCPEIDSKQKFRCSLWIMCAFDDDKLLKNMLQINGIPDDWTDWIDTNSKFEF